MKKTNDFTWEELELLDLCLSKYFYDINGVPNIVITTYEKIQKLKEEVRECTTTTMQRQND